MHSRRPDIKVADLLPHRAHLLGRERLAAHERLDLVAEVPADTGGQADAVKLPRLLPLPDRPGVDLEHVGDLGRGHEGCGSGAAGIDGSGPARSLRPCRALAIAPSASRVSVLAPHSVTPGRISGHGQDRGTGRAV